jgi:hypothetical protein
MCLTCGCGRSDDAHGDSRHITLTDLRSAAEAANLSVLDAATNLTKAISLVSKTIDRGDVAGLVIKADDTKRFLLTVAYPAWKPDVAVAADGHIDVAPADVVERACWNFMRKGARLGMYHQRDVTDEAEVVENYIYRGDPWVIKAANGTEQLVMPDDWLVGIVCSPSTWSLYKSNAIGGVSPQGGARRRSPSADTLARVRSRLNA